MVVKPPHVNHSHRHFTLTFADDQPILWMGLGQVRDLRKETTKKMIQARQKAPFVSLSDLRRRVPIQPKELMHLIQCGALDGLGTNRASLLAEGKGQQAQVGQLGFAFMDGGVKMPAESLHQRLQWEEYLLGFPVSAHPIQTKAADWVDVTPISQLPSQMGNMVTITGSRLPGWTGGKGFYFGDGTGYIPVLGIDEKGLKAWQPIRLVGRLLRDKWGNIGFQVKTYSR
jgi:DNA polymerase III alpha subunit